jgi:hypothetical protein
MQIEISEDGFLNMLNTLNKGDIVAQLDDALMDAVQGLKDHGGKAEITLNIKISPIKSFATAVTITPDIKLKIPHGKQPENAMFINSSLGLVAQPQEQLSLEMKPADTKQAVLQQAEVSSSLARVSATVTPLKSA